MQDDPLRIERRNLSRTANDLYSPENFPGSKAWLACRAAEKALADFDAVHPEVLAAIKAAKAAAPPKDYVADPNSFYSRALSGKD